MEGRFSKLLARLFMPVVLAAAMGIVSINAYAIEPEAIVLPEENEESDLVIREGLGEVSEVYEVDESDSSGLDVCFYIRTNVEDSFIPDEPSVQPTEDYTDAIRINNAISSYSFVYDNDITSDLRDDGFTASNSVSNSLSALPSVSEIQNVYPSFDPQSQYVFWYVIKTSGSSYPNWDVFVHVDGVVLQKGAFVVEEPEEPVDPENPTGPVNPENPDVPEIPLDPENPDVPEIPLDPENPDNPVAPVPGDAPEAPTVQSDLEFEIFSCNVEPPFEYDGEDHLIGGYIIRVADPENGDVAEYTYGPYGDFRGVVFKKLSTVDSISVPGTTFDFKGVFFNVNVDSAYLLVKNPGNYEIPFFFRGQQVSAADIIIRDESGKILEAQTKIQTPKVENAVSQRKITITAGSTIQNDNGSTVTNNEVKVTSGSLLPGHQLVTSIVGSQTGPGESVNEITYYDIIGPDGKSYKAMYDVTRENGWLILVKPNESAASTGSSTENANQEALVEGSTTSMGIGSVQSTGIGTIQSTVTSGTAVLGAQRNGDGTTGLLTKNGTSVGSQDGSGSANGTPQVLGARRGDTSDLGIPPELRVVFIVFCLMALMIINIKRSNN